MAVLRLALKATFIAEKVRRNARAQMLQQRVEAIPKPRLPVKKGRFHGATRLPPKEQSLSHSLSSDGADYEAEAGPETSDGSGGGYTGGDARPPKEYASGGGGGGGSGGGGEKASAFASALSMFATGGEARAKASAATALAAAQRAQEAAAAAAARPATLAPGSIASVTALVSHAMANPGAATQPQPEPLAVSFDPSRLGVAVLQVRCVRRRQCGALRRCAFSL
jgi:hypothetical protein